MHFLHLFQSADSHIGRVDTEALTDQARMELFIGGLVDSSKATFLDSNGDFLDVCEWEEVLCDPDGHVDRVDFVQPLTGELNFRFVPHSVTSLNLHYHPDLCGTLETESLPQGLRILFICDTGIEGTLNMRTLPPALRDMTAMTSSFHGPCGLTALPTALTGCTLAHNRFSGEIDLTQLPATLRILNLGNNQFSGEICLRALPLALESLVLNNNGFCGDFVLLNVPKALRKVRAEDNSFGRVATIERSFTGMIVIRESAVREICDEHGETHPSEEDILRTTVQDFLWNF